MRHPCYPLPETSAAAAAASILALALLVQGVADAQPQEPQNFDARLELDVDVVSATVASDEAPAASAGFGL